MWSLQFAVWSLKGIASHRGVVLGIKKPPYERAVKPIATLKDRFSSKLGGVHLRGGDEPLLSRISLSLSGSANCLLTLKAEVGVGAVGGGGEAFCGIVAGDGVAVVAPAL